MSENACKAWLNEVNWDIIHEDAVTMYLEWGNNNFKDDIRKPVTLSDDYSVYFVVDTWGEHPKAVLMKMNKYGSETLCEKRLPDALAKEFLKQVGGIKGIHEMTEPVKDWLIKELEG